MASAVKGHVRTQQQLDQKTHTRTVWGDQGDLEILTDYGQAYLSQYYLIEKFGKPFIQALFHNQDNAVGGVNSTLTAFNIKKPLQMFSTHDWSVAMLINWKTPAGGLYQFYNVDPSLSYYFAPLNIGTPTAPNLEAFNAQVLPPWGTDYIWVNGDPKALGGT